MLLGEVNPEVSEHTVLVPPSLGTHERLGFRTHRGLLLDEDVVPVVQ